MNLYSAINGIFRLPLLFTLLFLTGCISYKLPTDTEKETLSHPLYRVIPRHRCQIKWYDLPHWVTWMLFGNDDNGIFGESSKRPYRKHEKNSYKKALLWGLRNPFHNFCFYTIGTAHRKNSEVTILRIGDGQVRALEYCPKGKRVFGGKGTSFFIALHGWKPFISLRLAYTSKTSTQIYIGWRERGNFGVKCCPFKTK